MSQRVCCHGSESVTHAEFVHVLYCCVSEIVYQPPTQQMTLVCATGRWALPFLFDHVSLTVGHEERSPAACACLTTL